MAHNVCVRHISFQVENKGYNGCILCFDNKYDSAIVQGALTQQESEITIVCNSNKNGKNNMLFEAFAGGKAKKYSAFIPDIEKQYISAFCESIQMLGFFFIFIAYKQSNDGITFSKDFYMPCYTITVDGKRYCNETKSILSDLRPIVKALFGAI